MDLRPVNVLSLCTGSGGLDHGIKLAVPAARIVCAVEIEAYACEVLAWQMEAARLDQAPLWTNLRTFDGRPWRGLVDCVIGGYPCQPFSMAGKKRGADDPRHLWPDVARIVRETGPAVCFFENVGHHLRVGFRDVAGELHAMGYRVAAGLFTAAEIGATHKRERLFILAHREGLDWRLLLQQWQSQHASTQSQWSGETLEDAAVAEPRRDREHRGSESARHPSTPLAHTVGRFETWRGSECAGPNSAGSHAQSAGSSRFVGLPAWPPGPDDPAWADVLQRWPEVEPAFCGVVDGMADRIDRLRLCGNGVVPQVAATAWQHLAADLAAI